MRAFACALSGLLDEFNIDNCTFLKWLDLMEANYYNNPYHNRIHAGKCRSEICWMAFIWFSPYRRCVACWLVVSVWF